MFAVENSLRICQWQNKVTTFYRLNYPSPHPPSQLAKAGIKYMLHRENKDQERGRKGTFVKNTERK
jgi:hypothetical protein